MNASTSQYECNSQVLRRIREGDTAAVNEMITANLGLIYSVVETYIENYPRAAFLKDDMLSEGFLALADAVNQFTEKSAIENVGSYLGSVIHRSIARLVHRETSLNVPKTSQLRLTANGSRVPFAAPSDQLDSSAANVDDIAVIDLLDGIHAACHCNTERAIVDLRFSGYTDREIAEELGLAISSVHAMRHAIHERFLQASVCPAKQD